MLLVQGKFLGLAHLRTGSQGTSLQINAFDIPKKFSAMMMAGKALEPFDF
jgi:hypothetical protein